MFVSVGVSQAKGLFFDSKKVIAATSKAERKALSRFGSFVRQTARRSIRKRKRVSEPGQPPSSHTGELKRFIYFGYDPRRQSVVIGPVRLGGKIGDAPRSLEHGGRSRLRFRRRGRRISKNVSIQPRPFMGPALEKEIHNLPALLQGSIRG